eukprot:1527780-Rhodomonas_salina.3
MEVGVCVDPEPFRQRRWVRAYLCTILMISEFSVQFSWDARETDYMQCKCSRTYAKLPPWSDEWIVARGHVRAYAQHIP